MSKINATFMQAWKTAISHISTSDEVCDNLSVGLVSAIPICNQEHGLMRIILLSTLMSIMQSLSFSQLIATNPCIDLKDVRHPLPLFQ